MCDGGLHPRAQARAGRVVTAPERPVRLRPAEPGDFPAVVRLLEGAGLPLGGLAPSLADFIVAVGGAGVVGAVGLEIYGSLALLRSAVVAEGARDSGVGAALVGQLLGHARSRGVEQVYLLTTTAEDWFPRFGFVRVARDTVPLALHASAEFQGACPDSAIAMRAVLG